MTRKMIIFLASALLTSPLGISMPGGQRPVTPGAPVLAAPPVPPLPPELAQDIEAPEVLEAPEPPEPPESPEYRVLAGPSTVMLGDGGTWLGVRLSDVTAEKARELKLPAEEGGVVIAVEPKSPAANAGLEKNDVILEFVGERVHSVAQLQRLVHETPAGRTVALQVSRAGQIKTLSAKLEGGWGHEPMPHVEFPGMRGPGAHVFGADFFHPRPTLGITGEDLTSQLAEYFGVKQGKGVLINDVKTGSAAEKAGLKAGDVIVEVDGKQVASVSELRELVPRHVEEKKKLSLGVVRDRKQQAVAVELEPESHGVLRRAEKIEIPEVDLAEIKHLAAELQRQAGPLQDQIRQKLERTQDWQREVERALELQRDAWQQAQRKMEKDLKQNLLLKELEARAGII